MVSLKSLRKALASTFGADPPDVDIQHARRLCHKALTDVSTLDKTKLLQRVDRLQQVDDWQGLRCALFDVLSQSHGQSVARARLDVIDRQLR